jgi:hypothetical protein
MLPCRFQANQQFASKPNPVRRRDAQGTFAGDLRSLRLGYGANAVEQRQQLQHGFRRFGLEHPRGLQRTRGNDIHRANACVVPRKRDAQPTLVAHRNRPAHGAKPQWRSIASTTGMPKP